MKSFYSNTKNAKYDNGFHIILKQKIVCFFSVNKKRWNPLCEFHLLNIIVE